MKKHLVLVSLIFIFTIASSALGAEKCRYSMDYPSIKAGWTAYKTTEKTPVQGELPNIQFKGVRGETRGLIPLVVQMRASGAITSEKDVQTGNAARDATLFQKFFALWGNGKRVSGSVSQMNGNDKSGELLIQISMNDLKKNIPMKYEMKDDGTFEAKGDIDVLAFGLNKALESLSTACAELHKGKDGVSKTWSEVQLRITGKVQRTCTS